MNGLLRIALTVLVLAAAACQTLAPTHSSASVSSPTSTFPPSTSIPPTSTPAASPPAAEALAVLVNFPNGTGPQSTGYDLSLVAADGSTVAHTHAAARSYIHAAATVSAPAAPDLPEVSVANGRVYYLDGDDHVRYLLRDGSSAVATRVPGSPTAHAGFAISPDGSRIAVSVLTYLGTSATMDLYVEDVAGGNHHDLFRSSSEYAWPVAWHSGDLVLAVGPLFSQQGLWDNPYFAANFHVVDATTAERKAMIGGPDFVSSCEVSGLLAPTGTACYHRTATSGMGGVFLLLGWSGQGMVSPAIESQNGGTAAINPDQPQTVAILDPSVRALIVVSGVNKVTIALSDPVDSWPCWLDERHVLVGSLGQLPAVLVDIAANHALQLVGAHGFCAAILGAPGQVQ